MARVSLILGGARSGKSARGLELADTPPRVFIATAEALDEEMAERIRRHRAERAPDWSVAEAPLDLAEAIRANAGDGVTLLVDCLTLWFSNVMHANRDTEAETEALVEAMAAAPGRIVLISNEVGLGLVPETALGRAFRDAQGRLNRRVAEAADHVELVAAGLPLLLKGKP